MATPSGNARPPTVSVQAICCPACGSVNVMRIRWFSDRILSHWQCQEIACRHIWKMEFVRIRRAIVVV